MNFLNEHLGLIITIIIMIAGVFGLKQKAFKAGDKIGDVVEDKFSVKTREDLAEFMESFVEGLKGEAYNGNKGLISNEQIDNNWKKAKLDLGLKE